MSVSPWTRGQLLGKGSFGRVYLALQIGDQHVFVVKQVDKRMHTDNSDKEAPRKIRRISALKKENRMLRGLKHPNVVEYLGFEETDSYLNLYHSLLPVCSSHADGWCPLGSCSMSLAGLWVIVYENLGGSMSPRPNRLQDRSLKGLSTYT